MLRPEGGRFGGQKVLGKAAVSRENPAYRAVISSESAVRVAVQIGEEDLERVLNVRVLCGADLLVLSDDVKHLLAIGNQRGVDGAEPFAGRFVSVHFSPIELAEADETFKTVWTKLSEFRRDYAIWRDLAKY